MDRYEKNGRSLPCRVAFVPGAPHSDLFGAINCAPTPSSFPSGDNASTSENATSKAASRLKHGPPLLEIRRLIVCLPEAATQEPIFRQETLLVSRGLPGLGGNVSSTCLDFRPDGWFSPVRCATGLTSGALCVHSLFGLDREPPSSVVAHYAPRQQRPATSVAWRPGRNAGLVAVGFVGSEGKATGGGPGGKTGGPGGDRDFGCLVWDVEAQSSNAGGKAAAVPVKGELVE